MYGRFHVLIQIIPHSVWHQYILVNSKVFWGEFRGALIWFSQQYHHCFKVHNVPVLSPDCDRHWSEMCYKPSFIATWHTLVFWPDLWSLGKYCNAFRMLRRYSVKHASYLLKPRNCSGAICSTLIHSNYSLNATVCFNSVNSGSKTGMFQLCCLMLEAEKALLLTLSRYPHVRFRNVICWAMTRRELGNELSSTRLQI